MNLQHAQDLLYTERGGSQKEGKCQWSYECFPHVIKVFINIQWIKPELGLLPLNW